ncbi:MAG: hypothetical protein IH994_13155 [Proteobacteria bacterium]|nr:hypothetical protein [Pseudomonadota bacterium]
MPWFAVQDSDWDWDTADGPAIIVEADTPEDAVKAAYEKSGGFSGCDGCHCKVAEINLIGFMGGGRDVTPEWQWEDFQPLCKDATRFLRGI